MPGFDKSLFSGRVGNIAELVRADSLHDHLTHYHVVSDNRNRGLEKWGRNLVRSTRTPVLYVSPSGKGELLPEDRLPDEAVLELPFAISSSGVLIRLDKMPVRYDHEGAYDGGLKQKPEFIEPYNTVKTELRRGLVLAGFEATAVLDYLRMDPSIFGGVHAVGKARGEMRSQPWKQIVQYAMREMGVWDDSFNNVTYSYGDNCIENYPADFNFESLARVVEEFGGWLDFSPGTRQGVQRIPYIKFNLTTTSNGEKGVRAIALEVGMSKAEGITEGQKDFLGKALLAFNTGVSVDEVIASIPSTNYSVAFQ